MPSMAKEAIGAALGREPGLVPDAARLAPSALRGRDGGMPTDIHDEHRRAGGLPFELERLPHLLSPALAGEGPAHHMIHQRWERRRRTALVRGTAPPLPEPARHHAIRIVTVGAPVTPQHVEPELDSLWLRHRLLSHEKRMSIDAVRPCPEPDAAARMIVVEPGAGPLGRADVVEIGHESDRLRSVGQDDRRRSEHEVAGHVPLPRREVRNPQVSELAERVIDGQFGARQLDGAVHEAHLAMSRPQLQRGAAGQDQPPSPAHCLPSQRHRARLQRR